MGNRKMKNPLVIGIVPFVVYNRRSLLPLKGRAYFCRFEYSNEFPCTVAAKIDCTARIGG
jgi:hypothetical protein